MAKRKRRKITRQDWKPRGLLWILRGVWLTALSAVKLAIGAAATVLFIGIICAFVLIGALGDYLQEDVVPNVSFDLDNIDLEQTSFIYYLDGDGQVQKLQQIYADTDRQWATFDEIPEELIHAAVAIEDKRFYEHQGVDWITTVKACANMFFGGSSTFGGSTITQQLIKNLTQEDSVTVQRKVEEIFRAQKFEAEYDKDVVMEWYLNTIYLGKGCAGVKSAARTYFGKELDQLTIAECASMISITNNPSMYNPYTRPESNRKRQLTVLDQMREQGWITASEYEDAVAQEMVFTSSSAEASDEEYVCANCGFSAPARKYDRDGDTFLCPECATVADIELDETSDMYSWYTELVLDDVAKKLCEQLGWVWNSENKKVCMNMIKKGGYHIYACIDLEIQNIVDEIYTNLDNIPETKSSQQLLSAIVVIDNRTGDVVAVAGNVGEKTVFDAFSHATDEGKQTGSSMKPLTVYAPAFELGVISPASVIKDLPLNYDDGKFPLNDNRIYRLSTSILTGVRDSVNTTAVHVLDMIGTRYSFEFARDKFGLTGLLESEWLSSGRELTDIGYAPLALGALTYGITVRDMASAYATFPNDGVIRTDRTFTKVYDSDGNLLIDNTQESERILSERAVNYMNYCLRSVVSSGTAYYADLSTTAAGGKTGTSSDNRDRWFVGYTKYYTAAVWCGYKVPEEIRLVGNTTNPAGRLWNAVMKKVHQNVKWQSIYDDSDFRSATICLDSGMLATEACKADPRGNRTQRIYAYYEDLPTKECTRHVAVDFCVDGNGVVNEYCLQVEGLKFEKRGLLTFTEEDLKEIVKAKTVKDFDDYLVFLVDKDGKPKWFRGLDGKLNKDIDAPYIVCTVHNEETVKPTEPSVPEESFPDGSEPSESTEPTEAP